MNQIIDQPHDAFAKEQTREFFKNVYGYMFAALAISGIVAYLAGTPEFLTTYLLNVDPVTGMASYKPIMWVIMFAPVGLVFLIGMRYHKMSMGALLFTFLIYSVLIGLSLSVIFIAYTGTAIAMTFFVTAGAFAGMAILGYTTKTDLTRMGSLLYMVFIGIFIASIVNVFIGFQWLNMLISVLGVFVFTGLTAYYMQKLKNVAQDPMLSGLEKNKLAVVGGLQLYILFVNLFMSLLSLLGRD